jgi:hypothetical protein
MASRRQRIRAVRLVAIALLVAAGLSTARALPSMSAGELDDHLWTAIVAVESGGDPAAYNAGSGATGVAQIRQVCLDDCNRIARLRKLDVQFKAADRQSPQRAREMWNLYLSYYGEQYEQATGRPPSNEVYARIWNGGPTGWRKDSTAEYWTRVREILQSLPAEDGPTDGQ